MHALPFIAALAALKSTRSLWAAALQLKHTLRMGIAQRAMLLQTSGQSIPKKSELYPRLLGGRKAALQTATDVALRLA